MIDNTSTALLFSEPVTNSLTEKAAIALFGDDEMSVPTQGADFLDNDKEQRLQEIEILRQFSEANKFDAWQMTIELKKFVRNYLTEILDECFYGLASEDVSSSQIIQTSDNETIYEATYTTDVYDESNANVKTLKSHSETSFYFYLSPEILKDLVENYKDINGEPIEIGKEFSGKVVAEFYEINRDAIIDCNMPTLLKYVYDYFVSLNAQFKNNLTNEQIFAIQETIEDDELDADQVSELIKEANKSTPRLTP